MSRYSGEYTRIVRDCSKASLACEQARCWCIKIPREKELKAIISTKIIVSDVFILLE